MGRRRPALAVLPPRELQPAVRVLEAVEVVQVNRRQVFAPRKAVDVVPVRKPVRADVAVAEEMRLPRRVVRFRLAGYPVAVIDPHLKAVRARGDAHRPVPLRIDEVARIHPARGLRRRVEHLPDREAHVGVQGADDLERLRLGRRVPQPARVGAEPLVELFAPEVPHAVVASMREGEDRQRRRRRVRVEDVRRNLLQRLLAPADVRGGVGSRKRILIACELSGLAEDHAVRHAVGEADAALTDVKRAPVETDLERKRPRPRLNERRERAGMGAGGDVIQHRMEDAGALERRRGKGEAACGHIVVEVDVAVLQRHRPGDRPARHRRRRAEAHEDVRRREAAREVVFARDEVEPLRAVGGGGVGDADAPRPCHLTAKADLIENGRVVDAAEVLQKLRGAGPAAHRAGRVAVRPVLEAFGIKPLRRVVDERPGGTRKISLEGQLARPFDPDGIVRAPFPPRVRAHDELAAVRHGKPARRAGRQNADVLDIDLQGLARLRKRQHMAVEDKVGRIVHDHLAHRVAVVEAAELRVRVEEDGARKGGAVVSRRGQLQRALAADADAREMDGARQFPFVLGHLVLGRRRPDPERCPRRDEHLPVRRRPRDARAQHARVVRLVACGMDGRALLHEQVARPPVQGRGERQHAVAAHLDVGGAQRRAAVRVDVCRPVCGIVRRQRGGKRLVARHVQDDRIGRPRACGEREEDDDGKGKVKFSHDDCILQYPPLPCQLQTQTGMWHPVSRRPVDRSEQIC